MTGPEHYQAAERLLAGTPVTAAEREAGIDRTENWPPNRMELLEAQAHATLALAAATALPGDLHQEWLAATKPSKVGGR